jgi:hypothetical protein
MPSMRNGGLAFAVIAAFVLAAAHADALPNASGHLTHSTDAGSEQAVTFAAASDPQGGVSGEVDFDDRNDVPEQDVDGSGDPDLQTRSGARDVHARIDCLKVSGNVAVLGGIVVSAATPRYVNKRILLVAQDNGDQRDTPDRFTWGIYEGDAGVDCQTFPQSAYSLVDIERGEIDVAP